tara:strand:- start:301 stop:630 length:330 start_codon:yes stop_codon:yes gene_type:complete
MKKSLLLTGALFMMGCPETPEPTSVELLEYLSNEAEELCLGKSEGDYCKSGECVYGEGEDRFLPAGTCEQTKEGALQCTPVLQFLESCGDSVCVEQNFPSGISVPSCEE